ncbi:MAG: DNA-binding protein [Polyangiaceae bacterium]|nr:DNA-binding protein [Polyangiaceae bacterium]
MANTDVNQEIRVRIQSFVDELSELVKQATLESVQAALQGTNGASTRKGGRRAAVLASAARRAKGSKRTAEELDALVAMLLRHIQSNPGQRMEQLAASLDIASKELTLPIKKLLQENRLRTKGQKRATAYFAR